MRPLRLTMHHFGPFLDETVDFEKLGRELFLITGPTGSGKTTIFDGMCYALYGEGSNSFRQSREMKSQFGDPLEMMWVEFVFTLRDKTYKIRRVPEQERRRARGEGTALQKHEVALYALAGDEERLISASVEEIRTLVPELMGINANQFRQIVMLPQGEFSRLLKAPVDERAELLKSIFRMDLYQKLREKMSGRLRAVREERSVLVTKIASETEHLVAGESEALAKALAEGADTAYLLTLVQQTADEDAARAQSLAAEEAEAKKRLAAAELLLAAAKQVNARFAQLTDYQKKQAALAAQAEAMAEETKNLERAEAALRVLPDQEKLLTAQQKLLAAEQESADLAARWQAVSESAQALEADRQTVTSETFEAALAALRRQAELREKLLGQWKIYGEKRREQEKQSASVKALEQKFMAVKKAALALESQRQCCQDNAAAKLALIERCRSLEWEIKAQREFLSKLSEMDKDFAEIESAEQTMAALREQWKVAKLKWQRQAAALETARAGHLENLACVLAAELSEGEPCPVCGSVHHLKKPEPPASFVDDAALKALEQEVQAALKARDDLAREGQYEARKQRERSQALKEKIAALDMDLKDAAAVKEKIAAAEQALEGLEKSRTQAAAELDVLEKKSAADQKTLASLEREAADEEALAESLKQETSLGEQLLGQVKTLGEQLKADLKSAALEMDLEAPDFAETLKVAAKESTSVYEAQLGYKENTLREVQRFKEELASLEATRKLRTADVKAYGAEAASAETAFQAALNREKLSEEAFALYRGVSRESLAAKATVLKNYEFEVRETAGRVAELTAELAGKSPVDLAEGEADRAALEAEAEGLRTQAEEIQRRMTVNARQAEKLKTLQAKLTSAEAQMGLCLRLDETLKGTVKGRAKISFERYILSAYLQDILESANLFLEDMSAGRYRLEVMTEGGGRGLDIEVVDAYTGFRRSANTLSGGETFMAALAMALGLSDSVQSAAGGISLETIFIDEGFATLDPEALDKAISCLLTIKDDGRMVGIISHVEELKERIDTKITVTKTESGSHITY